MTLPLDTHFTLKDTTVGIVAKLHTGHFTQADLDALTAKPELLVSWALGLDTLPSAIVKGADDKVYYNLKEIGSTDVLTPSGTNSKSDISKYGVQSLLVKEDANGKATGLAKAKTIEGGSDGRYVMLPMVDTKLQKHLVTKCLKEIKGDITQVVDTECTP